MKIAIVRSTLHRGSGQSVHIAQLSRHLIELGNHVRIFSRKIEHESLLEIGAELRCSPSNVPFIRNLVFTSACAGGIKGFDIVHTQYHPAVVAGNWLHQWKSLPHVFTYHGFAPIRAWRNPLQKLKMMDHRICTYLSLRLGVDMIITVSNFLKDELVNWYRLDPTLIRVISNGVDLARFKPTNDGGEVRNRYSLKGEPIVAFVGRLAPYKGPQFLIDAIPNVLREIPEAKFLFIGSARFDVPKLDVTTQRPHVRNAIRFTGYVNDEILPAYYASCDVFCYPSLWEGFGLTPAEAQATGKPVVAFRTCALPEVIEDGVTGFLVPPGDSTALGDAIVRLLSDSKMRRRMGEKGRLRAEERFSWEKAALRTLGVYEEALKVHEKHR